MTEIDLYYFYDIVGRHMSCVDDMQKYFEENALLHFGHVPWDAITFQAIPFGNKPVRYLLGDGKYFVITHDRPSH